jgi:hypothetical protein
MKQLYRTCGVLEAVTKGIVGFEPGAQALGYTVFNQAGKHVHKLRRSHLTLGGGLADDKNFFELIEQTTDLGDTGDVRPNTAESDS